MAATCADRCLDLGARANPTLGIALHKIFWISVVFLGAVCFVQLGCSFFVCLALLLALLYSKFCLMGLFCFAFGFLFAYVIVWDCHRLPWFVDIVVIVVVVDDDVVMVEACADVFAQDVLVVLWAIEVQ